MTNKAIVYSKQADEAPVPVTARIDWLPDGRIRPRFYWTPDGSCYQVMPDYKCVPLAFLKERGEGLRFEVRAKVFKTSDPGGALLLQARHETYLYLADNWFCGLDFVDGRYGHAGKEFVPVTLDVFPNCAYELVYFTAQGTRYAVERTYEVGPHGSFHAGGAGVRHTVEVRQVNSGDDEDPDPLKSIRRPAALYFEVNKWFVAVNTA